MNREQIFWLVGAVMYLGILYALVRPGSKGPDLVNNIFNTLADLIRGSAGYSYDTNTNKWTAPSS